MFLFVFFLHLSSSYTWSGFVLVPGRHMFFQYCGYWLMSSDACSRVFTCYRDRTLLCRVEHASLLFVKTFKLVGFPLGICFWWRREMHVDSEYLQAVQVLGLKIW